MMEDSSLVLPQHVLVEPTFAFPPVVRGPDVDLAAHVTLTGPDIIAGGEHAAITDISMFGMRVVSDLRIVGARVTGIQLSPLGLERRITVAGREMIERTHLLDDRTCVIMEWVFSTAPDVPADEHDTSADDDPAAVRIEWRIGTGVPRTGADGSLHLPSPPVTGSRIAWHADHARLRIDLREPVASICFSAGPGMARITAVPTPTGASLLECSLTAEIPPGRALRLIISAGAGDDADAALSPVGDVTGRIRARSAVLRRRQREHIRLVSPDRDVDLAVDWAKQRIDWTGPANPVTGLAALAAGEFGQSVECIAAMARRQNGEGAIPGAGASAESGAAGPPVSKRDSTAAWLQLVARHLAWTGDLALAHAVWPQVRLAIAWWAGSAVKAPSAGLLASLAVAAETVGDTAALRAIEALRAPAAVAEPATEMIRFPASRIVAGTPDVRVAMAPLFALVDGLLGAAPDAVRGRLRLGPAAPPTWDRYEVSGLRMGEAVVDLAYRRVGSRHQFTLEQASGAIPIRVIFEPLIPGRALVAATVDGRQAGLVPRPHAHGLVVPVQVVMDHERSIVLEAVD